MDKKIRDLMAKLDKQIKKGQSFLQIIIQKQDEEYKKIFYSIYCFISGV